MTVHLLGRSDVAVVGALETGDEELCPLLRRAARNDLGFLFVTAEETVRWSRLWRVINCSADIGFTENISLLGVIDGGINTAFDISDHKANTSNACDSVKQKAQWFSPGGENVRVSVRLLADGSIIWLYRESVHSLSELTAKLGQLTSLSDDGIGMMLFVDGDVPCGYVPAVLILTAGSRA